MTAKGQLADYLFRGHAADDLSFWDFQTETYECKLQLLNEGEGVGGRTRGPGRPPSSTFRYLESHPRSGTAARKVRSAGHNTLGFISGTLPPRNDDPDVRDQYCASMLALFQPWRLLRDIKPENLTWLQAFEQFTTAADARTKRMMDGIQYYYTSGDAARLSRGEREDANRLERETRRHRGRDEDEFEDVVDETGGYVPEEEEPGIDIARTRGAAEELHAQQAILIAESAKIFNSDVENWVVETVAKQASMDDYRRIKEWSTLVKNINSTAIDVEGGGIADEGSVAAMQDVTGEADVQAFLSNDGLVAEEALASVDPDCLLRDQRRAYDIVSAHLNASIAGEGVRQLLMYVSGEGGVGKSKVIQTITDLFNSKQVGNWLAKGAFTGVAASLIGGRTLHSLLSMTTEWSKLTPGKRRSLEASWTEKKYLIIDEISMVSCSFLASIDRKMRHVKHTEDEDRDDAPFGGVNVIIFGDFHQFPPVMGGQGSALFNRNVSDTRSDLAVNGRRLYEQFECVVKLTEQVRIVDDRWLSILRRARTGSCNEADLEFLRALRLGEPECPPTDFSSEPWKSAVLVTPRHAVRVDWNRARVLKHCEESKTVLYLCNAQDTIAGRALNARERLALTAKREGDLPLPDIVEFAIGMKVMVTYNIATEMDVTNGARGIVYDVILGDEQDVSARENIVALSTPPLCVLVKLERTRAPQIPGLPPGVVPIVPMEKKFTIPTGTEPPTRLVRRIQLPITAAYAFTDYRAQGQTIANVIVDLRRLPNGKKLTAFAAYVALSRSRAAMNIRLLGDFDDYLFTSHPSEMLEEEDRVIDEKNKATRVQWEAAQRDVNEVPMVLERSSM